MQSTHVIELESPPVLFLLEELIPPHSLAQSFSLLLPVNSNTSHRRFLLTFSSYNRFQCSKPFPIEIYSNGEHVSKSRKNKRNQLNFIDKSTIPRQSFARRLAVMGRKPIVLPDLSKFAINREIGEEDVKKERR